METGIIEVKLKDGGIFRVTFRNSSQKNRITTACHKNIAKISNFDCISNGLHETKDFEKIINLR